MRSLLAALLIASAARAGAQDLAPRAPVLQLAPSSEDEAIGRSDLAVRGAFGAIPVHLLAGALFLVTTVAGLSLDPGGCFLRGGFVYALAAEFWLVPGLGIPYAEWRFAATGGIDAARLRPGWAVTAGLAVQAALVALALSPVPWALAAYVLGEFTALPIAVAFALDPAPEGPQPGVVLARF